MKICLDKRKSVYNPKEVKSPTNKMSRLSRSITDENKIQDEQEATTSFDFPSENPGDNDPNVAEVRDLTTIYQKLSILQIMFEAFQIKSNNTLKSYAKSLSV